MKKIFTMLATLVLIRYASQAQTPEEWLNQQNTQTKYLLQQIAAFQAYLGFVQKGYSIAHQGLTTIGNSKSQERLSHADYISSLNKVNPLIKNAPKVAAIISMLIYIQKTGHRTLKQVKQTNHFNTGELDFIQGVLDDLMNDSSAEFEDLRMVITPHQWKMTDEERLQRIDALYEAMLENQALAQQLFKETKVLAIQRSREQKSVQTSRALYGFLKGIIMKKLICILLFLVPSISAKLFAQTHEAEQLLLNVEKLAQLKQILSDMKKGYTVLSTGYNTIKNLSQGNYQLHQTFLDGLLAVSPIIRKYQKVTRIVDYQLFLLQEYKRAYNRFRQDKHFRPEEIQYLHRVYTNLFQLSLQNLEELATILTANQLRMSDEERLQAIDRIYQDMLDKLVFLRQFNHTTTLLAVQRAKAQKDVHTLQKIYGLKN